MYKYLINTTFTSLINLNDKTGATGLNIRENQIISIRLYVIQLFYYDLYEKRAKHNPWLSDIGDNGGVREKVVRILSNMYEETRAKYVLGYIETEWAYCKRGAGHGCSLSQLLF